ncbi:LAETG motif-containing sortase-dependent surface protein [Streptomyces sp. NPDC032940]|uniref:LAETG motif-containing sortase-dependent surface protein n=1 Tax=Streptomyces sp. NPDC032940 TaxID=3155366 RepID=UPI0033E7F303
MAAAAATAVIAPLALLAAPAAYADGEPASPSTSATESAPEQTESASPSATASETETSPAPSDSPTTEPSASATESAPASPTASATGSTTPTSPAPTASTPEESESPEPDVPFCEDIDANYGDAKVSSNIKGLPGKIVAGDGYHPFELVVTNESKVSVKEVTFYAEVENYEFEDESKFLSSYVDLEFKNPETGAWKRIGNDEWAGDYFYFEEKLKAGASRTVDMRLRVDAKAPAGDAYAFAFGAYLDEVEGQECFAAGWGEYDFQVLKPGSDNPAPGTAKPNDKGGKGGSISVKKPQGDVSELPTGSLAETGSSSALPMIGLAGGLAVVAGGGAVFLVRRRKAGAEA